MAAHMNTKAEQPFERVYTADYGDVITLHAVLDDSGANHGWLLEMTADQGDCAATIRLDYFHARELRLLLQRFEKLAGENCG